MENTIENDGTILFEFETTDTDGLNILSWDIHAKYQVIAESKAISGLYFKARTQDGREVTPFHIRPIVRKLLDRNAELSAKLKTAEDEINRLNELINTPHTDDFISALPLEAAHQIERWGTEHDTGKTALDWFWLIGYLSQKSVFAEINGDIEKAKHHTISTAAVMLNWFRRLSGDDKTFQPGINQHTTSNTETAPAGE